MPAFRYKAILPSGKQESGIIEAESARAARQLLRDRSMLPITLHAAHEKSGRHSERNSRKKMRLRPKERTLFTRQLATLLKAGLPLADAINATAEQTENADTRALILAIRSKILSGYSLAAALRDFPGAFSELYSATVAAGEKTGHLDSVLERLALYTEKQFAMRQKLMHAMIYPTVMIAVAVGITGFLLEFVVPRMITVYSDTKQHLPTMTQWLISISQGIAHWGLLVLVMIVMGFFLLRWRLKHSPAFKRSFHLFLLRLPLLRWAIRTSNTARFSRTFAILSTAGVSVLDAMHIAATLVTSLPIRDALDQAVKRVREGANIHLALKQTRYFSPMTIHMIASGEASGQLEDMLDRAAANEENDIAQSIDTSLALSEPLIILIMGGIVLFIVLAVLLPIFQLDQLN